MPDAPSLDAPDLRPPRRRPERPSRRWEDQRRMLAAAAPMFAARGPEVPISDIRRKAEVHPASHGAYLTTADVLAALLVDHLTAIGAAVARADDATPGLAPETALERLVLAWMDAAAAAPDAHHAYLLCAHTLPPDVQEALEVRRRFAVEAMQAALTAAVPSLAEQPEAPLFFYPLFRQLLSDPHAWPYPPQPEHRRAAARRLAGMLIAAAEAEVLGHWPRLGLTTGPEPGPPPAALSYNRTRTGLREVLDAAERGTDTLITRRGRVVARVVRAEGHVPPKLRRRSTQVGRNTQCVPARCGASTDSRVPV